MKYNDKYDRNLQIVKDTVAFKNKHVATAYAGSTPPAIYYNVTVAEHYANGAEGAKRHLQYINELDARGPINAMNVGYTSYIDVMESMGWWSHVKMPGIELPPNSVHQVEEKAILEVSDYDFIIENGYNAMTQKVLPKIVDMARVGAFFASMQQQDASNQLVIDAGYPNLISTVVFPPFETLCGGRSMPKFFMDCYKMPDKVKAAEDSMMKDMSAWISSLPAEKYNVGAWVGGLRGASSIVNQKIWDTLVWPHMRKMAEILVSKGIIPVMHCDACWDRDIARFRELPAKSVILNTDGMTDLRKARKALGDHVAFMGDIPAQMLSLASKQEIVDYVKRLVDDIGPQGLLLCPGCDAPATAKFENMAAIYETAALY